MKPPQDISSIILVKLHTGIDSNIKFQNSNYRFDDYFLEKSSLKNDMAFFLKKTGFCIGNE